jgi:hypothetical protein
LGHAFIVLKSNKNFSGELKIKRYFNGNVQYCAEYGKAVRFTVELIKAGWLLKPNAFLLQKQ